MKAALLAILMLSQPHARIGKRSMIKLASTIVPAAERAGLDPVLLAAVALIETGGRNVVSYGRGKGSKGADVGVFQIHCPRASAECVETHMDVEKGARQATRVLRWSRSRCSRATRAPQRPCRLHPWGFYNPGSSRWSQALWERYTAMHEELNKFNQVTGSK